MRTSSVAVPPPPCPPTLWHTGGCSGCIKDGGPDTPEAALGTPAPDAPGTPEAGHALAGAGTLPRRDRL